MARKVICVCKFSDTHNNVDRYVIQDVITDRIVVIWSNTLRSLISIKKIECVNIDLEQDNRIVEIECNCEKYNEKLSIYLQKCKLLGIEENEFNITHWGYTLETCKSKKKEMVLPPVTCIGNDCFCNDEAANRLRRVIIPDTVQVIGERAFKGCKYLEEVVIGKNVKFIGKQAFFGCSKLKRVKLPNSILQIGSSCFCGAKELEEVNIPRNVKIIQPNTFYMTNITDIEIPDSVKEIKHEAFGFCKRLQNVKFGNGLKLIEYSTFIECNQLTNIVIPESVEALSSSALYAYTGCNYMDIEIKSENIEIGRNCFCGQNINSIKFGKSVLLVEQGIFSSCKLKSHLKLPKIVCRNKGNKNDELGMFQSAEGITVDMGKENELLNSDFAFSSFTKVKLPDTINVIPYQAFMYADIGELEIPDGVTKIDCKAFYGCNMGRLVLPESIKSIEIGAFEYSAIKLILVKSEAVFKMLKAVINNDRTTIGIC